MTSFLQQVFNLLTTETGSLTYHLVLAFSIAAAWQAAMTSTQNSSGVRRRLGLGLGLLLLLRLVLFISGGLAWQGVVDGPLLLPPLDRAVTLLGLLVILWLWAFPERARAGDGAVLLLGLLVLTLGVLGIVWWSGQQTLHETLQGFNSTLLDRGAEGVALALLAIGFLLLLTRRPPGWGVGASLLAVLLAGHLTHLLLPVEWRTGSYPAAVRLAQMAAYPMLLLLPFRVPVFAPKEAEARPTGAARVLTTLAAEPVEALDPWLPFHALSLAEDFDQACQQAAQQLARLMQADIGLLLVLDEVSGPQTPQKTGRYPLLGYHLTQDRPLRIDLDPASLPAITGTLRRGRGMRLPLTSPSPDLQTLSQALGMPRSGHLLAAPAVLGDGMGIGVLLLSPHSGQSWDSEAEARLTQAAEVLARFLHLWKARQQLQADLAHAQSEAQKLRALEEQAKDEKQALTERITQLQTRLDKDQSQLQSLAAMITAQEEAQEIIARLRNENTRLQESLRIGMVHGDLTVSSAVESEAIRMGEEGGQAVQAEIAQLKTQLAEAEQKILALHATASNQPLTDDQTQVVFNLAQDLRQPLSSISGYTGFLLDESMGILGNMQRKFLEKIRVSTERMGRMVDELLEVTTQQNQAALLIPNAVDLGALLDQAIAAAGARLRHKSIVLRVDLPERLPVIHADATALQNIFVYLLQNAGAVTPAEGDIWLRASIESSEGEQDYVLVQVADGGEGIPPDELPRVFSPRYRGEIALLGEAEGISLATVKSLVEAMGGRVWVDNELGHGSMYSVLLPVAGSALASSSARSAA